MFSFASGNLNSSGESFARLPSLVTGPTGRPLLQEQSGLSVTIRIGESRGKIELATPRRTIFSSLPRLHIRYNPYSNAEHLYHANASKPLSEILAVGDLSFHDTKKRSPRGPIDNLPAARDRHKEREILPPSVHNKTDVHRPYRPV